MTARIALRSNCLPVDNARNRKISPLRLDLAASGGHRLFGVLQPRQWMTFEGGPMRAKTVACVITALAGLAWFGVAEAASNVSHGISHFGDLKYSADFRHFDYVNPDAPKGGLVRLEATGTFDTLNDFIIRGTPAAGLRLIYDTLMESAADEPGSYYGQLAETVEVPRDLSWVAFNLRPQARWHDGKPVTAEDVVFTLDVLKEKGAPFWRYYYANVEKAVAEGPHRVKFSFSGPTNQELPLIVGQLPVLPKHYWQGRDFEATTLDPPLGSGPYRVGQVDPGRTITLERVADYWGRDLPVMRGRYNFDAIRFEYYRDRTVSLEAFKAHAFDFRSENTAKVWATGYEFPAVADGRVIKETLADNNPSGMQSFAFNIRRPQFKDRRVREALSYTFDFEWSNKNLFYGQYTRTRSYFANSELASSGLPGAAELALLEPLRGQIPDEVFTKTYEPPNTEGRGGLRGNLRKARTLLSEAGWEIRDNKLVDAKSGQPMRIEILLVQAAFERVVAPMVQNMARLGIDAKIRVVDTSQYINRVRDFDFDMTVGSWGQSLSPGNEQRDFWGSAAADRPGSRNLIGIKDPVIDMLIDKVIFASDRKALVAACRALDRVLLWNHFVIPNWHINSYRIAYWNRFGRPAVKPKYELGFPATWWIDPALDKALSRKPASK
jgi:microcin C transport system substrate-binding protein